VAKGYYALRLIFWFGWELFLANMSVARVVLQPRLRIRPGILAYRTDLRTEMAITWLANLITLTPGTLTLAVSEDKRILYIHTLNVTDPNAVVASIRHAFEANLLELER
jgi:multicomponent Na+:H+ antiporter subunit E